MTRRQRAREEIGDAVVDYLDHLAKMREGPLITEPCPWCAEPNDKSREFHVRGEFQLMQYCPFCGGKLEG